MSIGQPASLRARLGLDLLTFFIADVQTGFGPFVAVYLTARHWTQVEIGFALSLGTITAMVSQVPAGALVDAVRAKRSAAASGIVAIGLSALLLAFWPVLLPVFVAQVLHGFASCMVTPVIATISLTLVGHAALGERLGRNARFAALGSGLAAGAMGLLGSYVSERAVFVLTALLCLPALASLPLIDATPSGKTRSGTGPKTASGTKLDSDATSDNAVAVLIDRRRDTATGSGIELSSAIAPTRSIDGVRRIQADLPPPSVATPRTGWSEVAELLSDRRLLVFAVCVALFHLANAAMLPLAAGEVTQREGAHANLIIAACIVVPQAVVTLLSPWVGRAAQRLGRRPILLLGWAALPLRGVLMAALPNTLPAGRVSGDQRCQRGSVRRAAAADRRRPDARAASIQPVHRNPRSGRVGRRGAEYHVRGRRGRSCWRADRFPLPGSRRSGGNRADLAGDAGNAVYLSSGMTQSGFSPRATRWTLSNPLRKRAC